MLLRWQMPSPMGGKEVDVNEKLKEALCSKLPFHLRVDTPVWQLLNAENLAAQLAGRTAFSYVDLTSKAMLPMWMPGDAIGGKTITGKCDWDPSASSATIVALGAALKAATQTPKFFRSLAQWNGVFVRYATAAVAMGQLTRPNAFEPPIPHAI